MPHKTATIWPLLAGTATHFATRISHLDSRPNQQPSADMTHFFPRMALQVLIACLVLLLGWSALQQD
jgi:hypothetical protein